MRTADGMEITHGCLVYVPGPWLAHVERIELDEDGTARSTYAGTVFASGIVDPARCYSTPEAAAAAWEDLRAPIPRRRGRPGQKGGE